MLSTPSLLARGARARSAAALLVLAVAGCDTNPATLAPTAADANLQSVPIALDLPTIALALGTAGSTLHAVRVGTQGVDTVAAVWRTADEQVVSVGNDGQLTPRSAGTTTVWARAGRDSASSTVTVTADGPEMQSNAGRLTISPSMALLSVGAARQFTVSGPAMTVVGTTTANTSTTTASTPGVKWTSSAPAVAGVSANGIVGPISPGVAVITATAGNVRASATVLVTAPHNATTRVDVAIMRFDGGSGSVMVSNGIPFARGAVTEATLNQVHVFVNGAEQAVFTRALGGRWPDGSLRAALVQFNYTIPNAQTIPGYIAIGGGARKMAAPAERPATPKPVAAALPTSPAYLISTGLAGAVYNPAATRAPTTMIAQYESDYVRLAALDWKQCGASWSCGRTAGYDRAFTLYQEWVRTADPTYWQHATTIAADYITGYLMPAHGQPAPWWSNSASVALHYWATGDERTRAYTHAMAMSLSAQARSTSDWRLGSNGPQMGDDRMRAKTLLALIDAHMIDAKSTAAPNPIDHDQQWFTQFDTPSVLPTAVSDILSTQAKSGAFGGTQYKGGQKAFMAGMLLNALTRYYDEVTPDSRIPIAIQRAIDYMWQNEWVSSAHGFKYCTVVVDKDNGDQPEPSLNNLIAPAYAWYYSRTGDARYATMVDEMLAGNTINGERNWWAASGKAFDQAFYHAFNVFQWRNR